MIKVGNFIKFTKNDFIYQGIVSKIIRNKFLFIRGKYEVYCFGIKFMVSSKDIIDIIDNKDSIL